VATKFDEVFSGSDDDDDDDDDDDRDGPRNVGFIRTPDAADSPRGFHKIQVHISTPGHVTNT